MGNPVARFEIGCRDKAKIAAFYERVFDWNLQPTATGADIDTKSGSAVPGAVTALGHEPHNYVMIYMQVENADAACDRIRAEGGKIAVGPVDIPGGKGRFGWFKDPEGNMLGVFQPPV